MSDYVVVEHVERAAHHVDDTIGVCARSASGQGVTGPTEAAHRTAAGGARCEAVHALRQNGESVHTRAALTCGLTGHERRDPRRLPQTTGPVGKHAEQAAPVGGAQTAQGGGLHRGAPRHLATDPGPGVSANEDGEWWVVDSGVAKDLSDRRLAQHLDDRTRDWDGAGQGHELRSGTRLRTGRPPSLGADTQDGRERERRTPRCRRAWAAPRARAAPWARPRTRALPRPRARSVRWRWPPPRRSRADRSRDATPDHPPPPRRARRRRAAATSPAPPIRDGDGARPHLPRRVSPAERRLPTPGVVGVCKPSSPFGLPARSRCSSPRASGDRRLPAPPPPCARGETLPPLDLGGR